jgi:hypothetical protein
MRRKRLPGTQQRRLRVKLMRSLDWVRCSPLLWSAFALNIALATGVCYEKGRGVEQSNLKAVHWYSTAAAQGHPNAQCSLGNHLLLLVLSMARAVLSMIRFCDRS